MRVDPSRDEDPIEQLLLTAYPNPERKGCPGRSVLESLANQERDQSDPNWYHIWHCSPCFAEFKELRDARWERERLQEQRRRRATWVAVAAVVCLAALLAFWKTRSSRAPAPIQTAQILVNLYDYEAQREAGQQMKIHLPPVPRAIDDLRIILPRFSEAGTYTVSVFPMTESAPALVSARCHTDGSGDKLELRVRLDLQGQSSGDYKLGTRLEGEGLVYYYPLTIQ
jgi:hypothetical protein